MTIEEAKSLTHGSVLRYDGTVKCEVIQTRANCMVVQFEDRASENVIQYRDNEWMKHLTIETK